jgi:hypothetical protein
MTHLWWLLTFLCLSYCQTIDLPVVCNENYNCKYGKCIDNQCVCIQGYNGHDCSISLRKSDNVIIRRNVYEVVIVISF